MKHALCCASALLFAMLAVTPTGATALSAPMNHALHLAMPHVSALAGPIARDCTSRPLPNGCREIICGGTRIILCN